MFRTEISHDLVRHVATAAVTVDAIASAYLDWVNHPQFDPFLPVIWDLRGQPIEIDVHDFMRLPQRTNRLTGRTRAGLRSAILVDNAYAEYVAKTISASSEWAVEFVVCHHESEALHWLRREAQPP